jgi:3-dehydroquinate dehydratase/shikimate dehydrogenase
MTIKTKRLILRPWQETDLEPFVELNADPRVMEYFPAIKSYEETVEEYNRILQHFTQHGWGFWAVALPNEVDFIGFIGLRFDDFPASFTPAVEIGWRLAFKYWGKGYASEGAGAAIKHGFEQLQLKEIISFTSTINTRSIAVMERLGMHHDPRDDFDHPKLPKDHKLSRHVLYRLKLQEWQKLQQT